MARTQRGLGQTPQIPRTVVAVKPLLGQWTITSGSACPPGASPDMRNCSVLGGELIKRPGYIQYRENSPSFGAPIVGLFSCQDDLDVTHLTAVTPTGAWTFNDAQDMWIALSGPVLTGTAGRIYSMCKSQNAVVFSQGADPVMMHPLGTTVYSQLATACPPARFLERYNARLNLGFTIESGILRPFRHKRCVASNHLDWTGQGAGVRDQEDIRAHMRGMKKLGTQLALYYEEAIELATSQPNVAAPFRYDIRVQDIGLKSEFTLKGRNERHFFLGTDDFYEFSGGQPTGLAPQVRQEIFDNLSPSMLARNFAEMIFDAQAYVVFLCQVGNTTPNIAWVCNWATRIWYPWDVAGMRCSTLHRSDHPVAPQLRDIDPRSPFVEQFYPVHVTGGEDGKVYAWGRPFLNDNGAAIPCKWTSHDFTSENTFQAAGRRIVLNRITVEYQAVGNPFTLRFYFSNDGGTTWTGPVAVTGVATVPGSYTMDVNQRFEGNRIRFKFENATANETFRLSGFNCDLELERTPERA